MHTDQPRPAAASTDSEYSLSIEDAAELYARAGFPRDRRTLQRYCAKGHLECHRVEIPYGEKYMITPTSAARHIAYIKEVRQAMAGRGQSGPVALFEDQETGAENAAANRDEPRPAAMANDQQAQASDVRQAPTGRDEPRLVAAESEAASRYVSRLEGENTFLREQITVKDVQIKDLTERARETNHLIAGLQKMLSPLLGRPGSSRSDQHMHSRSYDSTDARDLTSESEEGDNP